MYVRCLIVGIYWRSLGPGGLWTCVLQCPWLAGVSIGHTTSSCVPSSSFGRQRLDGYSPDNSDMRSSSPCLPASLVDVASPALFLSTSSHHRRCTSAPRLVPGPLSCVRWCQVSPSAAYPLQIWWLRPTTASPYQFSDQAAMGLLRIRPGRNLCSACQCWQRRRSRASFSFLEALPRPSSAPLFELRGDPRPGSPDWMAAALRRRFPS